MANQDEAKRKIQLLAVRAKNASTTYTEDVKLDQAVKAGKIKNRADLSRVLEESLNKKASDIHLVLASDDGDRLADEIVSLLED